MADRIVKVLENNRYVTRGVSDMGRYVEIELDQDETLLLTVDWSNWLGSETIASTTNEADGPTVGAIATTGAVNTFTIGGNPGYVQHRITTSAGQTKELRIRVIQAEPIYREDYGWLRT